MTHSAMLFYSIVGGALALCLIVLAALFIRRLYDNHVASNLIRMMDAEDWMGWDEDAVTEAMEEASRHEAD